MNFQEPQKPVLIYYGFRGKVQSIRYLMCYLKSPFIEIHAQKGNAEMNRIPLNVKKQIEENRIDTSNLPLLIHEGEFIYDVYPIAAYICRRFGGAELLGRNAKEKAKVQELIEYILTKHLAKLTEMCKMIDFAVDHTTEQIKQKKSQIFNNMMEESHAIRASCEYLINSQFKSKFVLGNITIIDFMMLEYFQFNVGVYGDLDKKLNCPLNKIKQFFTGVNKTNLSYINVMREYTRAIEIEPFYLNNKGYLESFTFICSIMSDQKIEGFKKLWVGDPLMVSKKK